MENYAKLADKGEDAEYNRMLKLRQSSYELYAKKQKEQAHFLEETNR